MINFFLNKIKKISNANVQRLKFKTWYLSIIQSNCYNIISNILRVVKLNYPNKDNKEMLLAMKCLITLIVLFIITNFIYTEFTTLKRILISSLDVYSNFNLNYHAAGLMILKIFLKIQKVFVIFFIQVILPYKILYINSIMLTYISIIFIICLCSNFYSKHINHFIFKKRTNLKENFKMKSIIKDFIGLVDNLVLNYKEKLRSLLIFLPYCLLFTIVLRFSFKFWLTSFGFDSLSLFIPYVTFSLTMPFFCYFYNIVLRFIIQKQIEDAHLYFFNENVVNNINLITLTLGNTILYLVRHNIHAYYIIFIILFVIILLFIYIRYYSFIHSSFYHDYVLIEATTGWSISFLGTVALLTIEIDISNLPFENCRLENPEQHVLKWTETDRINVNQRMLNELTDVSKFVVNTTNNFSNYTSIPNLTKLQNSSILKMVTNIQKNNLINKIDIPIESNEIIVSKNIVACQGKLGENTLLYVLSKGGYSGDRVLPTYIGNLAERDIKIALTNMTNINDISTAYHPESLRGINSILVFTPVECIKTGNIYLENNTYVSKDLGLLLRPSIYYSDLVRFREQNFCPLDRFFSTEIEGGDTFDRDVEDYRASVLNTLRTTNAWENLDESYINSKKLDTIKYYLSEAFGGILLLSQDNLYRGDNYLYKLNNGNLISIYDAKIKLIDYIDQDKPKFSRRDMLDGLWNKKEHLGKINKDGVWLLFTQGTYLEILYATNWTDKSTLNLSTYIDFENKYDLKNINTGSSTVHPIIFKQQYNLLVDEDRKSIKKIIKYISDKNYNFKF